MKGIRFFKNAALLTLTGLLLRGLGMVFRIYISAKIGEEGMGLYQLISSVYFMFITVAQSGVAVVITRLCAKKFALSDNACAYKILKNGVAIAFTTGTVSCVLMFASADPVSRFFLADMRCVNALRVLAFSLPFIAVCNVISAYFMAKKNVINGCTAQILEQLVRMAVVACAAAYFADRGVGIMLAAVFFANTLSEAVSCTFLSLCVLLKKRPVTRNCRASKGVIIRSAVPIAASRYLASVLHTVENMMVPSAVALFTHSRTDALSAFGALKGMAIPLIFFPSSFLSALSSLLVPEITEAHARGDKGRMKAVIDRTCTLTIFLSVMISGVFVLFHDSLGTLIYNSSQVSGMLLMLAPIIPFMYLDSICDGLLKGLGLQKTVFYHNCVDSGLRIILVALIVPRFGINGFIGVMAFSNILISMLNLRLLLKTADVTLGFFSRVTFPVMCAALSAIITKILFKNGAILIKTVCGVILFCALFMLFTLIFYKKSINYKNS